MLDPTDTEFLGYQVDHLEAEQGARFLDGLAQRLDKPVSNQPRPVARARARPTATIAPISTAPRRAIAPATTGPRQNQTRLSFSPEKSDIEIVDDIIPMAGSSSNFRRMSPPLSARRPARAAATSASARVSNLYTQSAQVDLAMAPPAGSKRARDDGSIHSLDDDDSMDFDDSFLRQIDAAEARAGRPMDNFINDEEEEEEEEDDWDDSSFIRQVDEVEKQAQARPPAKTSRFFPPQNGRNGGQSSRKPVYVVDSDGGSGKENCEPDIVYISD
jgi:RecQ-mediated genome instability protein 1